MQGGVTERSLQSCGRLGDANGEAEQQQQQEEEEERQGGGGIFGFLTGGSGGGGGGGLFGRPCLLGILFC
jgi:hypothetical protein